ncbi:MAG: TIGR01777 family oxidoreductase [Betaproteobacteria bacterium]|nr:TIGR01777 family oxidoreductase [Betaproteobacteria bacterium]
MSDDRDLTKQTILITGANGLVARRFAEKYSETYALKFLTRKKSGQNEYEWNLETGYVDQKALEGIDYLIHLAGANVGEKRWTEKRKQEIISSRVNASRLLLSKLKESGHSLKTFISASGVGYYGNFITEKVFTEEDNAGTDFLALLCRRWEEAAHEYSPITHRVLIFRCGVVLSDRGGALPRLQMPIQYGLGANLGSGNSYLSWIHVDDLCKMIHFSIQHQDIKGIYNAVSPEIITMDKVNKNIARSMKRPFFLPNIPACLVKLILGEMSSLLLTGNKVSAEKILSTGFTFDYPVIEQALNSLSTSAAIWAR